MYAYSFKYFFLEIIWERKGNFKACHLQNLNFFSPWMVSEHCIIFSVSCLTHILYRVEYHSRILSHVQLNIHMLNKQINVHTRHDNSAWLCCVI